MNKAHIAGASALAPSGPNLFLETSKIDIAPLSSSAGARTLTAYASRLLLAMLNSVMVDVDLEHACNRCDEVRTSIFTIARITIIARDIQLGHRPIGTVLAWDVQDFQMSKLKFYMKLGRISILSFNSTKLTLLEPVL